MLITSKANPVIKEIGSLLDKKYRKQLNAYLVEGVKPVKECIASGGQIIRIICTQENASAFSEAIVVSDQVFKSVSSEMAPQGVIAEVKLPKNEIKSPKGNCILLERIQDPGNLGTIIRTANAAGVTDIYLVNCADPYSPKAVRASMSGIFFVNIMQGELSEICNALENVPLICADMAGEDVFSFVPPEKYCLCVGNEGAGLSDELFSKAAYTVSIPMCETCESLNAGVSAGIAMYVLKNNSKRG